MRFKGINYDVGIQPLGAERPSRPVFDMAAMRREIEIIRDDLHCNAIRITGRDPARLMPTAQHALEQGLHVWLSPALHDASPGQTLAHLAECAAGAESLRRVHANLVFVVGCELTLFMSGLVLGRTGPARMQTFLKPWRLLLSTVLRGPFNWRLNRFLARAVATVKRRFHGEVTYASGTWESIDWRPFDYVGIDYYRDAGNRDVFRENLGKYFAHRKPVIATEFGCCTYRGAADKGGYGWAIVDWSKEPAQLRGEYDRDEAGQAQYATQLLDLFASAGLAGAFVFTFVAPKYPCSDMGRFDLDRASYALVKTLIDRNGERYPDLPWEPKLSFDAVAAHYSERLRNQPNRNQHAQGGEAQLQL